MMASIDDLERATAGGWQAKETAAIGDWLLRAAEGFTGRANSALAIGDPGVPLDDAIERVLSWYLARGLRPMISIAFPVGRPEASALDRLLADRGWPVRPGAIVMTSTVTEVACRTAGAVIPVAVHDHPDESWLALYRFGGEPPPVSRKLLMSAPWQAFGSVREAGQAIAIGRVAVSDGWAGLTAVEVHENHRRRGLGAAVTGALTAAAAGRGVTSVYLQVFPANEGARRLYERCGFTEHHAYHYRMAPAGHCS
ncbi:MAG TPA: GNAT family N-acetyltransferase [Streptosporangiaceae bacterium]|nr:GNAT family N-acetyltransferase [Streptosporangiaceae bacterium]